MEARESLHVVIATALEQSPQTKLDLLDASVDLARALNFADEAELVANIAANLRAADQHEQALLKLLEAGR